MRRRLACCVLMLSTCLAAAPVCGADGWQAGFSRKTITPEGSIWLTGYAGRNKPAEGKYHDLYARVAVLQDPAGEKLVVVSLDLIGVPAVLSREVSAAVEREHGIPRERIMYCSSHTHCGPALDDGRLTYILFLPKEEAEKIPAYQRMLHQRIREAIAEAVRDLQPARLAAANGHTGFASPRRPPIGIGPYDHDVPVLRVLSADGKVLRGVVFGYACHNTTMDWYQFFGDYAGVAQLELEQRHPGAVALFFSGCGGDQNPLPRRRVELAVKYGTMLADAVDAVLEGEMRALGEAPSVKFRLIDLPLEHQPSREELEMKRKSSNKYEQALAQRLLEGLERGEPPPDSYPHYPVQVWQWPDGLTWVALGGEVTVEYSLRIKRELGGLVFVTGYANDVMAYIPSERVLAEGGYEGDSSMIYYQFASKWAPGIENRIVQTVCELAGR